MDELQRLAKTGKYLFHGSATNHIQILEPRQARSYGEPDGKPCIAAAEVVQPAIFMAVLGSRHVGGWGKGSLLKGHYGFYVHRDAYHKAKAEGWRGYVYVLPREPFEHFSAWEWRAYVPVKSLRLIEVKFNDLPEEIELHA